MHVTIPGNRGSLVGHAARLTAIALLGFLLHAAAGRREATRQAVDLAAVPLAAVQHHLAATAAIGGPSPAVAGGRDLLDADGRRIGTLLTTSPAGDDAIGFSGPTDVLVVCDGSLRVVGMEILSSGDTRDHVRAVEEDHDFLESFIGMPLADLAELGPWDVDAVAGSTLTSLAIVESLAMRVGGQTSGSRFTSQPTLADARRIFPAAAAIEQDAGDAAVIRVRDAGGLPAGWLLRTSPAADAVLGYQGPTDTVVGFDSRNRVCGVAVLESFDNDPYVGYVRDDAAFRGVYRGMTIEQLAGIDPAASGIEGVSGATMTSRAVAEGILRAARTRHHGTAAGPAGTLAGLTARLGRIEPPQWGAIGLVVVATVTAFTRARGGWFGRIALPLAVVAYLGFGSGALLSQAQLLGWVTAGVPASAAVLTTLTAVAILSPATTRRNIYCSHLCAHGAAQQLILRLFRPKGQVPTSWRPVLAVLPWGLLVLAILVVAIPLPLSLVDLEPFDAYLPMVAGLPAILIFTVGLAASARYPMAYCRHGCPTGALLDQLRLNRRSGRLTWKDGLLLACLAVAAACCFGPAAPPGPVGAIVFAGPAMGTTYRVRLAARPEGLDPGEVHAEIEAVLAEIDQAVSNWRRDSCLARFNAARVGEWVEVSADLARLVELSRKIHGRTDGAFDPTATSAGARGAMHLIDLREASGGRPAAIRKRAFGVRLDFGGIGPGYAVDRIGERLAEVGSAGHLVELGGETRAWGRRNDGMPWRVWLTHPAADGRRGTSRIIELADGEAMASSTRRPGRSPIDPSTGEPVGPGPVMATVRAASCGEADALAVAAVVRGGSRQTPAASGSE